jgi:hypothetical protein
MVLRAALALVAESTWKGMQQPAKNNVISLASQVERDAMANRQAQIDTWNNFAGMIVQLKYGQNKANRHR